MISLKFKCIYFNWRLITLQYCIGFAMHQHESATGIHMLPILNPLPPPSPYHPSGSSQCTSPQNSVSCIKPGLEIHFIYDITHVSMPFSQIIPLNAPDLVWSRKLSRVGPGSYLDGRNLHFKGQCRKYRRHSFDPWVEKIPWRREWQPTPVFLPGTSHGQRSLVG